MLTLLHLSDIHFAVFDGDSHHDLEERVREEMLRDIKAMRDRIGTMDAVLVVGDIASRGQQAEYDLASRFLDRTCDLVGCDPANIVCVPGNHDIDRREHDGVHAAVRERLRRLPPEQLSNELLNLLREPRGADVLLSPLATYSRFALRYGCDLSAEQLTWRPKQFPLGSRSVLIYGLTSAWICDATDSDASDEHRVVVGAFQGPQVSADPHAVSIALVHHPPNWLRDAGQTTPWLSRAHLVLTGHEHAAGITPDGTRRSLAIASGAVNPDRTEIEGVGWVPAYNVIRLSLSADRSDELDVEVHVRCWQRDRAEFGPDDRFPEDPYRDTIRLDGVTVPPEPAPADVRDSAPAAPEPIRSDARAMIFRIMRAAPDLRRQAASDLDLIGDSTLRGLELDRYILERAVSLGRLADLDGRIDA